MGRLPCLHLKEMSLAMINNKEKQLIIVGASGFGKEVAWLATECQVQIKGFLDDDNNLKGEKVLDYEVLGNLNDSKDYLECQFIVAIGSPRIRVNIVKKMIGMGVSSFGTLIHPSVSISQYTKIGAGTVICAGNILTTDIIIGEHCHINLSCTIGHDTIVKDYCTIAPQAIISGNVRIHPGVEIGTGSAIRQGILLESGSMLGMGAVLTKNTEPNKIYIGAPAQAFKEMGKFEC